MIYDIIVIGSGPGGYVAAIRASQLGMKVAIIEKEKLGGICLNWGCIPTKALLKSAQVFNYIKDAEKYGIKISESTADYPAIISRSRGVAENMSKGIDYLMKKNNIDVVFGTAKIKEGKKIDVTDGEGKKREYVAKNIIIATGARSRDIPSLKQDGKKIFGYREAMTLKEQPKRLMIVGSGAIGVEFAYFYNSIGTEVTIVENRSSIVPVEDEDVSKALMRSFKKSKIKVMTNAEVVSAYSSSDKVKVLLKTKKGEKLLEVDAVLSAVGIKANIENLGLEDVGITVDNDKIVVDEFYNTNVSGYFAIGDVVHGPALAHVASAEAITAVEYIKGLNPEPIKYNNVPGCTYTNPQVASVGMTEKEVKEAGRDVKIGKFPFSASGKAASSGNTEGFVKVIYDAKYGEMLGCHMIGENVTEMISEAVVARNLETTAQEILKTIHPHPTMSEAVMEATADAYGEVIHL